MAEPGSAENSTGQAGDTARDRRERSPWPAKSNTSNPPAAHVEGSGTNVISDKLMRCRVGFPEEKLMSVPFRVPSPEKYRKLTEVTPVVP